MFHARGIKSWRMGVCEAVLTATIKGANELIDMRRMLRGASMQGALPHLVGAHERVDGGHIMRRLAR